MRPSSVAQSPALAFYPCLIAVQLVTLIQIFSPRNVRISSESTNGYDGATMSVDMASVKTTITPCQFSITRLLLLFSPCIKMRLAVLQ